MHRTPAVTVATTLTAIVEGDSPESVTFLECFIDVDLTRDKVLVVLHVREDAALVDPVVVVGTEEEDGKVADVVAQALNVRRHQARVTDLSWPPPAHHRDIYSEL